MEAPERIWLDWEGPHGADHSFQLEPYSFDCKSQHQYIRADLAKPRVKQLEWECYIVSNNKRIIAYSVTPMITYRIAQKFFPEMFFSIEIADGAFLSASTLDAAKAAAQADYERRILSAITTRSAKDVRKEALDEAAKLVEAETSRNTVYQKSRNDAAAAIRNLMEQDT